MLKWEQTMASSVTQRPQYPDGFHRWTPVGRGWSFSKDNHGGSEIAGSAWEELNNL